MTIHYRLDWRHNTVECSLHEWAAGFGSNRRVAETQLPDGAHVSTVFLGMEHGWDKQQRPLLFETMLFLDETYGEAACWRYATWDEAVAGHERMVGQYSLGTLQLHKSES